ncbi:hypothetical protein O1R50_09130, partial [Glycomyces luteolus]
MMRYQHQPQPPFHESLASTWTELAALVREADYDQIRGLYLHRKPGTDEGHLEVRFLGEVLEALAESESGDIEADFAQLIDRIRTGAVTVDVADLVGLAITVRDEERRIMVDAVFTDGTTHATTAHPEGPIESTIHVENSGNEENAVAAAMVGLLDAVIGDRHEQVTSALQDALALCLRNGFQAAIGIWEQEPGVYQARPYPDLGQGLIAASQAGASLEAALKRAAKDLRSRQQRKPKRPPAGFGWIRYDGSGHGAASITGIAVLDGWVYFGSSRGTAPVPGRWRGSRRPHAAGRRWRSARPRASTATAGKGGGGGGGAPPPGGGGAGGGGGGPGPPR